MKSTDVKILVVIALALGGVAGCKAPNNAAVATEPASQPAASGKVCCRYVTEGDILVEDFLAKEECLRRERGEVITVDPMRLTPHPCCPDAKGARCGGGVELPHYSQ